MGIAVGATYDEAYRSAHSQERSRLSPLHGKCNATYDLLPAWVNTGHHLLGCGRLASRCKPTKQEGNA